MRSFGDRFWDVVCLFSVQAYVLLGLSVALLALMAWVWHTGAGSAESRALIPLNVGVLTVNVVVLTAIVRRCRTRDM